ncbi:MAG: glycosyltransferase family 61 protein [Bacteroidales bacterium]|nr:glycosyltransferase family 61 protein [Bacteroidales bacterium]
MPDTIKYRIIKKIEKIYIFRILLFMKLFLNNNIRKHGVSKIEVYRVFSKYIFKSLLNHLQFTFLNLINIIRESRLGLATRKFFVSRLPFYKLFFHKIKLPENLKKSDFKYHTHRDYFIMKPLRTKIINNCHVYLDTDFGIVFKNLNILKDSVHGKLDIRNIKILKPYNEIIFENYINNAFRKDSNIIVKTDNKKYLLIHHWFNYYHWITESLYRLLNFEGDLGKTTLILPDTFQKNSFVTDSLKTFPDLSVEYIPSNSVVFFKSLEYVTHKKYCDHYDAETLRKIKKHFVKYVHDNQIKSPIINDKIFISRKNIERRGISNEDAVLELINKYNFAVVDFEDYSFYEQIAMMQQAKYLIGTHGSGLTNMIFMKGGSKVLDLYRHLGEPNAHNCLVYWRLAGILKLKFYVQYSEVIQSNNTDRYNNRKNYFNTDFHTFNLKVDTEELEKNLKLLLSSD